MRLRDYINESESKVLITEAGFNRVIQKMINDSNDFSVITAYRNQYDKKTNINRNRQLRGEFNSRKMGVYELVGYWQECQLEGVSYEKCPKDKLYDVIERSYLVIRPESMEKQEFIKLIGDLTKKWDQDGSVLSIDGTIQIIEGDGNMFTIGNKTTLNKIKQAYSRYTKRMDVPFVFEMGAVVPGSNTGRMIFEKKGIHYPIVSDRTELKELKG